MLDTIDLQNQLINYIYKSHSTTVTINDDLLETGIIQSMDFILLISFIEKISDTVIPQKDLIPENFRTINRIMSYIFK